MSRPAAAETLGMALGLVAVTVFAGSLPATRLAVASLDPNFVTAARAAIAGLIALPVLVVGRRPPPWRELPRLGLCALCLVAGFPAFTAVALRSLPAAHGGVVLGAMPLATAAFAALVDRDRPSRAFWLCSGLGAALVVGFALSRGGGALQSGDALLFGAVACAACGYTWSAQLSRRLSAPEVNSWIVVLALPASLPLSFVWQPADLGAVAPLAWASLAYVGAMSMYFGYFAWNAGLALGGVARVSQVQLLQPFLTFAIAAVTLGERIDAGTAITAPAVVTLVFASRRARVDAPRTAAAQGRRS
jgi:drug/metabolite transporter (DMT)-like permease